jgi:type IV pilus assembly protein PilN
MRISINLASKPFTDLGPILRQLRIAMGALAVLALGFWIGLHFFHAAAEKARARTHSLDGEFAKLNAERQGYQNLMNEPDNARVLTESQALNQLFDEKTFSWTLAMEDLERVLPGGVQVATLEPLRDPKTGIITVKMRIQGPRDKVIDLVRNLEHSRRFVRARIMEESVDSGSNTAQKQEPISLSMKANFNLQADYNLPSEEESKAILKKQKKPVDVPVVNKREPYPGAMAPARPAMQQPQQQPLPQQQAQPIEANDPSRRLLRRQHELPVNPNADDTTTQPRRTPLHMRQLQPGQQPSTPQPSQQDPSGGVQ